MTERVAIDTIRIENRRREVMGDIAALARNIDQHGLIHPIVISDENVLIAGERRLRAHQHLGHTHIDARRWIGLDENQRREIELAENLDRKDLTAGERSRKLVELAEVAADVLRTEGNKNLIHRESGSRGPAPTIDGQRAVADRIGVSQPTISRAREHVSAIEKYPSLEARPQSEAIRIAGQLDELPEETRIEALTALETQEASAGTPDAAPIPWPEGVPDIRHVTDEEKVFDRLITMSTVTRMDPVAVAAAGAKYRTSSARNYLERSQTILSWHQQLVAALEEEFRTPLRRVK